MPSVGEIANRKYSRVSTSQTLAGSNTTVATALFRVTGTVQVNSLYAVVTTVLGSNVTAAYYRLNDQTAQVDITLNTGTTLSSVAAGSTFLKKGLATAAVTLLNNSAGRVSEPTTLETTVFSPFVAMKKTAANTDIEFVYTTTNTPTSGVITHFIEYEALSADGLVAPL
jgi:hypothetical protein